MRNYKQASISSLPSSLTSLYISSFAGSYQPSCATLKRLKKLSIRSIDPTLSTTLLTNLNRIKVSVSQLQGDTIFLNTSLESLHLTCHQKCTLSANSLPPTLKYLTLSNTDIQSNNVVPPSCTYLKSCNQDINPQFIPQCVTYIKL
ncbi:hypothetical protein CYY_000228 [Polysphondylium violaceum]|uniref:Uncharacterized protein n=1 Tax=Polysphondylium violaceum TaxID=133409 RepID=A0A8J4V5V9_9MYCE|nr:hypothetical protein CYY_000228 [Polysphondylium violaceum]